MIQENEELLKEKVTTKSVREVTKRFVLNIPQMKVTILEETEKKEQEKLIRFFNTNQQERIYNN